VKILELPSHPHRATGLPAPPRPAGNVTAMPSGSAASGMVLAIPRLTGGAPFLTQYLAQEFGGANGAQTRWRERDGAYRLAGIEVTPARLILDV
jgi:hypothetical protein